MTDSTPSLVERKCLTCGRTFFVPERVIRRGRGKYCSRDCANKSPIFAQQVSNNTRLRWQDADGRARYMKAMGKRSESDQWRNAPHFQKGVENPRFKGGKQAREKDMARYPYKKWRLDVFRRDEFTCRDCGQKGGYLIAHHVIRWADNPALRYGTSNGITLCESCHDKRHGWSRKPKTYHCIECGALKKDGRGEICRRCASKRATQAYVSRHPARQAMCPICGITFPARRPLTIYCSRACQGIAKHKRARLENEK